jgi:hypothetical protein
MFISKKEKTQIEEALKAICMRLEYLSNDFLYLSGKVKALEGKTPETKKPRKKHTMSPEGRARMSQMMKDRHAKNKLEKENATSISTTGQ